MRVGLYKASLAVTLDGIEDIIEDTVYAFCKAEASKTAQRKYLELYRGIDVKPLDVALVSDWTPGEFCLRLSRYPDYELMRICHSFQIRQDGGRHLMCQRISDYLEEQ